MDTLILTKLILGATLIGDLCLLFLVLKEERSVKKLLFAIFVAGITGWTASIFINLWAHSETVEAFVFGWAAVFLTAQVLFAQLFPNDPLPRKLYNYWSLGIGGIFFIMSFWSGAVFSSLAFSPQGYTIVENGFFSAYYSLFALAFVAAPTVILIWKFLHIRDPSLRSQLKYLIIGFSIFLGVNILTNSLLPVFFHIFFFNAVGPVFSLVLAGFVFYIIWRYEFLDIHTLKNLLRERTRDIETMRLRELQLMQDIAHAQQTSLTILKADLERLKQHYSNPDDVSILDAMEHGIDRSSSLTYELLRAARLEMQPKNNRSTVDLSALAKGVVEYVGTICESNNLSLSYEIGPDIVLPGDEKQLEELFLILLSNAVKYRKPDVSGTIKLTLKQGANSIVLSVADTGIGIGKEHMPFLFERLYRANPDVEGNGLGLAIAKTIAETHGGTIAAHSTPGKGSEFTVRF